MSDFPEDEVLLARGKYSTRSSERRALLKAMRSDLENISTYAGRVLRAPDDVAFMREQAEHAAALHARVMERVAQAELLQAQLDELDRKSVV